MQNLAGSKCLAETTKGGTMWHIIQLPMTEFLWLQPMGTTITRCQTSKLASIWRHLWRCLEPWLWSFCSQVRKTPDFAHPWCQFWPVELFSYQTSTVKVSERWQGEVCEGCRRLGVMILASQPIKNDNSAPPNVSINRPLDVYMDLSSVDEVASLTHKKSKIHQNSQFHHVKSSCFRFIVNAL